MKKLKAVCALSLAGLLLFSLSGCGGEKKEPVKAGTQKLTVYWGALEGSGSAGRQTARFRPKRTDCWKNTFLPTLPKFPTGSKIRTVSGQASMWAIWVFPPTANC